ncbi:DIP1984 family protein [Ktedonobacter robiniae]|uniref:Uncharacterized protein n=1 Tax=Ktedonobacter robiniae TaxID=2778365 RepID=A0ABQ3UY67_9CHLR|nr:DIP1984 family protein [Ktedonobacter robiniae]GHO57250.1 hypothetical protein KSB_57250 [Ktedonobacter robiniae]
MKLAEALVIRADLQRRVELLRTRLVGSAKVQEGETPPENPDVLFRELEQSFAQFVTLITQINRLSLQTQLPDGRTLTKAIAQRDIFSLQQSVLMSIIEAASTKSERYSHRELRYETTVSVGQLRQQYDDGLGALYCCESGGKMYASIRLPTAFFV